MNRICFTVIVAAGLTLLASCEDANQLDAPAAAARVGGLAASAAVCDLTVPTDHVTIQGAVDAAAPGDVVCVETGTYVEQVVIDKDLTLIGIGDPVLQSPADPGDFTIAESGSTWEPILFVHGGTATGGDVSGAGTVEVNVLGLVVDGNDRQPSAGRSAGILLRNVRGAIADNTVQHMGVDDQETFGIVAYGDSRLQILGNDVSGYERTGIGATGDGGALPDPQVWIGGNTVTGSTGIGVAWAPNGIQVSFGATGGINRNTVMDNRWSASDWEAACILVFESDDVLIGWNVVENCDAGIAVSAWGWLHPSADNVKTHHNTISESIVGIVYQAAALSGLSGTDASVSNGGIADNDLFGGSLGAIDIEVGAVDSDPTFDAFADNNTVIRNSISGSVSGLTGSILAGGSITRVQAYEPALP